MSQQPEQPLDQEQQFRPEPNTATRVKKKRSGCLTALLVFACVIVGIVPAAYIFVPGLLKPYSLGVNSSRHVNRNSKTLCKARKVNLFAKKV
jgi:hypothetical protein